MHLAAAMKARGDDVLGVDARGQSKPLDVRRWPWSRQWFRPDVEARRGRRWVYGDAKRDSRDVKACIGQLTVLAHLGRELIICVPENELLATAEVLDDAWGLRHFGRLRLLGSESEEIRLLDSLRF